MRDKRAKDEEGERVYGGGRGVAKKYERVEGMVYWEVGSTWTRGLSAPGRVSREVQCSRFPKGSRPICLRCSLQGSIGRRREDLRASP